MTNPTHRPSGEKNGDTPPSVPVHRPGLGLAPQLSHQPSGATDRHRRRRYWRRRARSRPGSPRIPRPERGTARANGATASLAAGSSPASAPDGASPRPPTMMAPARSARIMDGAGEAARPGAPAARAAVRWSVRPPDRSGPPRTPPAVANRSAGSFSSAVSTAASTCGGMLRRWARSGRRLARSAPWRRSPAPCGPVNGGSPTSIS